MIKRLLYSFFRSSARCRVRIALRLKHIVPDVEPVDLLNNDGENRSTDYLQLNPQSLVPALAIDQQVLFQSCAILEHPEENCPQPALLASAPLDRAYVRGLMR